MAVGLQVAQHLVQYTIESASASVGVPAGGTSDKAIYCNPESWRYIVCSSEPLSEWDTISIEAVKAGALLLSHAELVHHVPDATFVEIMIVREIRGGAASDDGHRIDGRHCSGLEGRREEEGGKGESTDAREESSERYYSVLPQCSAIFCAFNAFLQCSEHCMGYGGVCVAEPPLHILRHG